jgi:hypothetical protein
VEKSGEKAVRDQPNRLAVDAASLIEYETAEKFDVFFLSF